MDSTGKKKKKEKTALLSLSLSLPLSSSFRSPSSSLLLRLSLLPPTLSEVALLAALHADLGEGQADEEADVVCF